MQLPKDILTIKDIFKANGFQLFVVGGAVRDAVLGKTPKDFKNVLFF
jgi:tRNA nucleotidyltransferase/poly(A) polymerase